MNALSAIVILILAGIVIWGLVVLLRNPFVQALLVLFTIGGFLLLVERKSKR
jgi:hypothetical protein